MRKPPTTEELREVILEEWDKITIEEVNKCIGTMHLRVDEVIQNKGDTARF